MATITSTGSGNWSSTTPNAPWPSGIVPVLGDKLIIAAGHVVTVEGTYSVGDDTTTAVTINGTLKASRSVNSQITFRGELIPNAGSLDYGTEADPIPAGVTAIIVLNDSAVMATQKYGLRTVNSVDFAGLRFWGADKTGHTTITAPTLSTDTVIPMADTTGWQIGDWLGFGPSVAEGIPGGSRFREITNIAGLNVTIGADLGFASQVGRDVFNVSRNVKVKCVQGNLFRSQVYVRGRSSASASTDTLEIGPVEFNIAGGETAGGGALTLEASQFGFSTTTNWFKKVYRPVWNPIWSISGSTVVNLAVGASGNGQIYMVGFGGTKIPVIEEAFLVQHSLGTNNMMFGSTNGLIKNCKSLHGGGLNMFRGFGGVGPQGLVIDGHYGVGGGAAVMGGTILQMDVLNSTFNGPVNLFDTSMGSTLGINISNCTIGGSLGFYNVLSNVIVPASTAVQATVANSVFPAEPSIARTGSNINTTSSLTKVFFRNWNNDVLNQKVMVRGGIIYRDNVNVNRGLSSIALSPWYSGIPLSYAIKIPAAPGEVVRVIGYLRFNTAYGTATPPSVVISGLGATPVSYTCTATANTWFQFDLSITNPQAYAGEFDLTFTGQSAANSVSPVCWMDGVAITDFVPLTRHYGFLQNNSPKEAVDPNVTQNEATVAARTTVDTLDDLYDASAYWTATTPLSGAYRVLVTANGTVLDLLGNNLVVDGTASNDFAFNSGTNTITIKSSVLNAGTKFKTFTTTGSVTFVNGASAGTPYTSSAGTVTTISVTGLIANSRVFIKNVTDNTVIHNAVVAGTSLNLAAVWTSDKTLLVRVQNTQGLASYDPVELNGVFTSSGASFLVSQVVDAVYASNAINGSTVTEFTADYPNIQVDINDPDGTTSVQRLYAWFKYIEYSAMGIEFFHEGIVADDVVNYQVHAGIINLQLDNQNATPVIIVGARLYRDDGTTVIYSGSGSIQLDPAKAYVAGGASIAGAVRIELTPELNLIKLIPATL